MKFNASQSDDVMVIQLIGGLEGGPDSYKLIKTIQDYLEQGHRKFLLNLNQVGFINSSGIGIIASTHSKIAAGGGEMKLCNANKKVSRVMMITKLLEVFESYPGEEEALNAFRT